MRIALRQILLVGFMSFILCSFAAPRKDANGHYMVKSITRVYIGKKTGVYNFTYNALDEIVKVEYSATYNKYREVWSRCGNKITYKQYNDEGRQNHEIKYEYVLDDDGQIKSVSENPMEGGSQAKIQNDYKYQDGRLVYGQYREYHTENLRDKPLLFDDTFFSKNYDCPDGDIEATLTYNDYIRDIQLMPSNEGRIMG